MDSLPQIMQDLWPWVLWIGAAVGVAIGIGTLIGMTYKSARRHMHHKEESDER